MSDVLKSLKIFKINKKSLISLPTVSGIYIFWSQFKKPIYIGKSINLKKRIMSYFSISIEGKTKKIKQLSKFISYIEVSSELEALLLEAYLVKHIQPMFNVELKDDKNPLYIRITNEIYPRVITARKIDENDTNIAFYGPFTSSKYVKKILYFTRKIIPYSDHKIAKKACIFAQLGLCKPCPSYIEKLPSGKVKSSLQREYKHNIFMINMLLSGRMIKLRKQIVIEMNEYAKSNLFEKALEKRKQLETIDYITQRQFPISEYLKNPNFIDDIRKNEIRSLKNIISNNIKIKNLQKIECYDISHFQGNFASASLVTFINGQPDKNYYKHFKIRQNKKLNDTASLKEVISRRLRHLKDWGIPDLIIVDGGKAQVKTFFDILSSHNIPVVGLAKRYETLVFIKNIDGKYQYSELVVQDNNAKNILQRIRNEAHRFAQRYHHIMFKKYLYDKSANINTI